MKKGKRLITTILAATMVLAGSLGTAITAQADICGGLEEEDIYDPAPEDVVHDPVLHWAIRSSMNAVKSKVVLTEELVGDKMVSYISFEQNRHPEDFEGWKKQFWIEDLEGIQYAKSAKMINICYTSVIEGKKIKSVEPLSKLTQLQTLLLKENGIQDISSLKTLANLTEFDVAGNEITDIDAVAGMEKLKKLNVAANKISDISSLSKLGTLEYVDLSNNKVNTLPNMENLGNVTYFNAENNNLTDISELANLKHLQEINLSGNEGIKDVKALANLIHLEKEKTYLPDESVKEDLFAAIDVNKLFNKFNISKMQPEQLESVNRALKAYDSLKDSQKEYIEEERVKATRNNYEKVSRGEEPTYYPEYDEGGDRIPIFDRIEISVVDKHGKPLSAIEFTQRRESAYTSDEKTVTTDENGKLILYHKQTDVFYDDILVYPAGNTYVANPDKISYAVLNMSTDLINGKKATGLEDLKIILIPKDEFVDKIELGQVIAEAEKITEEYKYTKDSWKKFETAYKNARELYENVDAKEKEVKESTDALKKAMNDLEYKEVLTALKLVIKDSNGNLFTRPFKLQMRVPGTGAEAWNEWSDAYTSVAYITASPAWEDGKEWEILACNHETYAVESIFVKVGVAEDGTRYFKEVDGKSVDVNFEKEVTVRKLDHAPDTSNEIAPDGTVLKEYVEAAKKYDALDYTPTTYKALSDAIAEAELVLKQTDVIQEDYNAAAAKIKKAEAGLSILADKTELKKEINLEFSLNASEYTDATWEVYQDALIAAKKVDADRNATAEEIENARKNLEKARVSLQKKTPELGEGVLSDATTFRMKVQDKDGNAISGVKFNIEAVEDPSCGAVVESNSKGEVEYKLQEWDYNLTFHVDIIDEDYDSEIGTVTFKTTGDFGSAAIIEINGNKLESAEEILCIVSKGENPNPQPGDKVLSDENTFRAKVVDESGKPLAGLKFLFDSMEDVCTYTIDSNTEGILEYTLNSSDYDLEFTVGVYDSKYEVTPEKVVFVTNAKSKIVSVNGKELPVEDEIVFTVKTGEKPEPEVDKEGLKSAIEKAKAVENKNYTEESWSAFQQAIKAAEDILNNDKVTQNEVNAQITALEAAEKALIKKEPEPEPEPSGKVLTDKTAFRAKVVDKNGKPLSGIPFLIAAEEDELCRYECITDDNGVVEYKVESWDFDLTFNVSIRGDDLQTTPEKATFVTDSSAKIVRVNGKELPVEDEIVFTVKTSEEPEPEPEVNKEDLKAAIEKAQAVENKNYTEESWSAFQQAIKAAEDVVNNDKATQDEVNAQVAALKAAENALIEKEPEPEPEPEVDKEVLEKAIEKAEAIEKGNYTDESWNALQEAIKTAKAVLVDEKATQADVDAQVKALEDAIKALKTKPEPGKPNPDKPENPNKPNKPEKPGKPGTNNPVTGDTTKPNGNKVVFDKGSGKGIRFNTGIGFDDFDKVLINGKVVDPKYYTVEESSDGKTIIVLKNSYLEKLENGKYTFEVVAKDGTTEKATFTVKAKASEGTTPKTGDTMQPFVYVVGILVAVGAVTVIFRRKRTTK